MATPWYAYPITQGYGQNGEQGIDLGTPFHTPITALFGGTVRTAGRTAWRCGGSSGGMITVVSNIPGLGVMTAYYLHTDTALVKVNDTVRPGQVLGLSGGQLAGGQWPVHNCPGVTFSTGPHTEFGFNASWVSGPGHNIDPTRFILAARNGTLPVVLADGSSSATVASATGGTPATVDVAQPTVGEIALLAFYGSAHTARKVTTEPNGLDGLCQSLEYGEQIPEWNWMNPMGSAWNAIVPVALRLLFIWLGLAILFFAIWAWIRGPLNLGLNVAGFAAAPEVFGPLKLLQRRAAAPAETDAETSLPAGVTTAPEAVAH